MPAKFFFSVNDLGYWLQKVESEKRAVEYWKGKKPGSSPGWGKTLNSAKGIADALKRAKEDLADAEEKVRIIQEAIKQGKARNY